MTRSMTLAQLIPQYDDSLAMNHQKVEIRGLALNSKKVKKGDVFFAISGSHHDGRRFIGEAIENNASAVLVDADQNEDDFSGNGTVDVDGPPIIAIKDLGQKIGGIASTFYDEPSKKIKVIGITGTNGKTSCAHFLAQALGACGHKCGIIGTLGYGSLDSMSESLNTTPDALTVQRILAEMVLNEVQYVAMEVSSHALVQGRVNGVQFYVSVFTNLSRDHLDYHPSMDEYAQSKFRLFKCSPGNSTVINLDDAYGQQLMLEVIDAGGGDQLVGFSLHRETPSEFEGIKKVEMAPGGSESTSFVIKLPSGDVTYSNRTLIGAFNLSNVLTCAAVLFHCGVENKKIGEGLSMLRPIAGRLEPVVVEGASNSKLPTVFVDYAHTPDALEKTLQALNADCHQQQKIICVFGCGGDRDRGKRREMGKVSSLCADVVLLTSDNSRSESSESIIREIEVGVDRSACDLIVEQDRAKAIRKAILMAASNDIVLIAGKGHENYQEENGRKVYFSDYEQASLSLQEYE